jgi:hypothetical protein
MQIWISCNRKNFRKWKKRKIFKIFTWKFAWFFQFLDEIGIIPNHVIRNWFYTKLALYQITLYEITLYQITFGRFIPIHVIRNHVIRNHFLRKNVVPFIWVRLAVQLYKILFTAFVLDMKYNSLVMIYFTF